MGDYRDENYRDYRDDYGRNQRGDYRDNYRDDYREDYRDYRDEYGRNQRYNRRNYRDRYGRNQRSQEDMYMMLQDLISDGMELARTYEDVAEMTTNSKDRQMLMKIAEREKEHYRTAKEMLEKGM